MTMTHVIVSISILIIMNACDYTDPHTLNVGKTGIDSDMSAIKESRENTQQVNTIYGLSLFDIDEQTVSLSTYQGKVLLVVNTSSRCGYTPQYEQLQELYEKYQSRGLEVLAFPSNDFGGQELKTNEEVATFCYTRYSVDFPLFAKTKVRGKNKHPLYQFLTEKTSFPGEVRWNFEKFLVNRNGTVIGRYYSNVLPLSDEIISDVERATSL